MWCPVLEKIMNPSGENHKGLFQAPVRNFHLTWEKVHSDTEAQPTLYAESLKGHNCECILWKENYKCYAHLIQRTEKDNCSLTILYHISVSSI